MLHEQQNPPLLYFGLWIMNFLYVVLWMQSALSHRVVFKKWKRGSRDGWSAAMRNGAVQNVFGIRLRFLAGVVGGACDDRWREKSRTFVWGYREVCWNYCSGRKLDMEDSSLTSSGVFLRVDWWIVASCKHIMTFRRIIEPSSSG